MNRKKSIVWLNRSELEPHPDNPRKDLGDLTELRESIRQNGIMQNLTVIPTDDTLAAVKDFNSILHSLGYNVPDELDASILDGTSELYEPGDDD